MTIINDAKLSLRRSYGGVFVIPIFTKPFSCRGQCIFCPKQENIPPSYILNSGTQLACDVNFCPKRQFKHYLKRIPSSHQGVPIEIIILGGSFTNLSEEYRRSFIDDLYSEVANYSTQNNIEDSCYRISILSIEARPDEITDEICKELRELGVSKVEIGVQHFNTNVLNRCKRGHTKTEVIEATRCLKDNGFKVGYHIMLGLPGSTYELDKQMIQTLSEPRYSPDFLKIYPCVLLKNKQLQPELYREYEMDTWSPPSKSYIIDLLNILRKSIPETIRISRIQRFFDEKFTLGGFFRGLQNENLVPCHCIRCREAGKIDNLPDISKGYDSKLRILEKENEVCLEIIANDKVLLALARLRLSNKRKTFLRELHVYGKATVIGTQGPVQGNKIGSTILNEVELYAKTHGVNELFVNAAHGAKPFFRKKGYLDKGNNLLAKNI